MSFDPSNGHTNMTYALVDANGVRGQLTHRIEHDWTTDGPTIVADWQCDGSTVIASSDRLGLVPLFYWQSGSTFVISDSLADIVAEIPTPAIDDAAVATFLQLGYYVGDATPIAGVKVMPPDARLAFDGQLSISLAKQTVPPPFKGSFDEAVATYASLFERAIASRAPMGVGRLTVSGGRDSRHILLELVRQGFPPPAIVTQDRPVNTDLEVGELVARRVGLPHIAISPFRDAIHDELAKNAWNHYLADENSWYVQIAEYLDGPVFDGLGAGVLSGSDQFPVEKASRAIRLGPTSGAEEILRLMGSNTEFLRRPWIDRWSRDLALETIRKEIPWHVDAPNPLKSFLFGNRTRREISLLPITMASRKAPVYLPYLDAPLLSFLSSLPYESFFGHTLHDAVIRQSYPDSANIPFGTKRRRPPDRRRNLDTVFAIWKFGRQQLNWPRQTPDICASIISGDSSRLGWFFRVLPILQLSVDLRVPIN